MIHETRDPPHDPAAPATTPARRPTAWRGLLRDMFSTGIDKSPSRMRIAALGFFALYGVVCGKLIYLGFRPDPGTGQHAAAKAVSASRPDILDRNGEVMASDVKVMSVFAEPRKLIDKDEATELLTAVLPDVNALELRNRLATKKGFVWVKREVTPHQRDEVFHLGLPGVGLIAENKRVYPNGPIGAHVLGFANIDNAGIAGIEKYIDGQGLADLHTMGFAATPEDLKPINLSLDIRATHALRDELYKGVEHFKAKAGAAAIMDVNTGEVIALTSLPDYDPNKPTDALDPLFRQICLQTYHGLVLAGRLPYPRFVAFLVSQLEPPADAKPSDWYDWLADLQGGAAGVLMGLAIDRAARTLRGDWFPGSHDD